MEKSVLIIVMLNFYVSGMRRSISMMKTTSGIFHQDRYAPFVEAAINLIFSIVLVQYLGIAGVFIGTLISTLLVPFWIAPYLVYKNTFNKPLKEYFLIYLYYTVIGFGTFWFTYFVCSQIHSLNLLTVCLKGIIALLIPNIIYVGIFYKTEQFKYLLGIAVLMATKMRIRKKKLSDVAG